jgi:hypothetical protein
MTNHVTEVSVTSRTNFSDFKDMSLKSTNILRVLNQQQLTNYPTWKGEMKAYLHVKGLCLLVNGSETRPMSDTDAQAKWDVKADKAAGELYLACSVEQRMHIDVVQDDPVKIWTSLASIHLQQHPGARFNAWDDFFSIRKLKSRKALLMYSPPLSSLRILIFRLDWVSAYALNCLNASKTSDLALMGSMKRYLE